MRRRRAILFFTIGTIVLVLFGGALPKMIEDGQLSRSTAPSSSQTNAQNSNSTPSSSPDANASTALAVLDTLEVKGWAPKTGYSRDQFGNGWGKTNGCDTRNIILYRDLKNPTLEGECKVASGTLQDPYTGKEIQFTKDKSDVVQIDHVVALSNAWQTGAGQLSIELRKQLANDPLELLAVDGPANQQKSDGDAATWLPKNKAFRCEYVARQIAVKKKYTLWVTDAEKQAIIDVLNGCVGQGVPG